MPPRPSSRTMRHGPDAIGRAALGDAGRHRAAPPRSAAATRGSPRRRCACSRRSTSAWTSGSSPAARSAIRHLLVWGDVEQGVEDGVDAAVAVGRERRASVRSKMRCLAHAVRATMAGGARPGLPQSPGEPPIALDQEPIHATPAPRPDVLRLPEPRRRGAARGARLRRPARHAGRPARRARRRRHESGEPRPSAASSARPTSRTAATSCTTSAGTPAARTSARTPRTRTSSGATWWCRARTRSRIHILDTKPDPRQPAAREGDRGRRR